MAHECPSSKRGRHSAQFFARVRRVRNTCVVNAPASVDVVRLHEGEMLPAPSVEHELVAELWSSVDDKGLFRVTWRPHRDEMRVADEKGQNSHDIIVCERVAVCTMRCCVATYSSATRPSSGGLLLRAQSSKSIGFCFVRI